MAQTLIVRVTKAVLWFAFGLHRWIANRLFVSRMRVQQTNVLFKASNLTEYYARTRDTYQSERIVMNWMKRHVGADDIVYDIGANIGTFSIVIGAAMRDKGGTGRVYAFEPESQNYARLNENIILNNLSRYVFAIPLALGDRLKVTSLYIPTFMTPGAVGHAIDKPETAYRRNYKFQPLHTQGIIAMSLDDFVQLENVRIPNHIKIDVDGFEGVIVKQMRKILEDVRLKTIVIEVDEYLSGGSIQQMITSHGFRMEDKEEIPFKNGIILNALFVREGKSEWR